jgi:PAS domain S-box-containing protein
MRTASFSTWEMGAELPPRDRLADSVLDAWDANVAVLDADGDVLMVNRAWRRFAAENGGTPEATTANYLRVCEAAASEEPRAGAALAGIRAVLRGEVEEYTLGYPCHGPLEERWFRMTVRRLEVAGGTRLLVVHEDVTDRKRIQDDVRARSLLLDEVDAAVVATDRWGVVTLWNRTAERLFGWPASRALGRPILELTVRDQDRGRVASVIDSLRHRGAWEGELLVTRADGTRFPIYTRNTTLHDDTGSAVGMVGVSVDLSERVAMERELAHSNRQLRAITDSVGEGMCTLDEVGRVTYMNPAGLRLLRAPLDEVLGSEHLRWLRIGDDPGIDGSPSEGPVVPHERVLVARDGSQFPIECVATPLEGQASDGPAGWVIVFRDITERRVQEAKLAEQVEQLGWLARIRHALEHDGFELFGQPIIELATGRTVQHELLLRMRDPDGGYLSPGLFLPTAEALGLAPAIDRWVVSRGLELAAGGWPVEINLSARSLDDPELPQLIERTLERTGADPASVVFEITETALIENDQTARHFVDRVHQLGCQLALDDFGTGYGGFTYLKRLPVDFLKIDIEFVRDVVTNPASRHVTEAVVSLAQAFGLRTVAEGVEDEATLELLTSLGVDLAQGYHLGRPAPFPPPQPAGDPG